MEFIPGDIFLVSGVGLSFANATEQYSVSRPYQASSAVMGPNLFGAVAALSLSFSPDFSVLAIGSIFGARLNIFDAATGNTLVTLSSPPPGGVNGISFSADGARLACAHAASPFVSVYQVSDWSKYANPSTLPAGTGNSCAFDPAGLFLAVAHNSSPYLTIYNVGDLSKVSDPSVIPPSAGLSVDFNHDGTLLAITHNGAGARLLVYSVSGWSLVSLGTPPPSISQPKCKFSPNGAYLAYFGSGSNGIYVYETSTWTTLSITSAGGSVGAVAWLNNTHLVFNANGYIRIIDVQTNAVINNFLSLSSVASSSINDMVCLSGNARTLSGTVRDVGENGIERLVTAIHAASGRRVGSVMSEPITGEFELTVWGDDKHNVICAGQSIEISQVIDALPE